MGRKEQLLNECGVSFMKGMTVLPNYLDLVFALVVFILKAMGLFLKWLILCYVTPPQLIIFLNISQTNNNSQDQVT